MLKRLREMDRRGWVTWIGVTLSIVAFGVSLHISSAAPLPVETLLQEEAEGQTDPAFPAGLPRGCRDRACARARTTAAFFEFMSSNGAGSGGAACGACANYLGWPQDLDNAYWTKTNSVAVAPIVTANAAIAPDGTLTAERVQYPFVSSGWSLIQSATITPGPSGNMSASWWVKGNGQSGSLFYGFGGVCNFCNYNPDTWTLCKKENNAYGVINWNIGNDVADCGGGPYAAADVFIWGAQWNTGAAVNAYVPAPSGAKGEALTFSRASAASCLKTAGTSPQLIANGDMLSCVQGQTRVMPGDDGTSVNGLLVESSRTNSLVRSQQLENASWVAVNSGIPVPTVTADFAVAPDGTITAERFVVQACPTIDVTYSFIDQIGLGGSTMNTSSVFCRGNGSDSSISLCNYGNTTGYTCAPILCKAAGWTRFTVSSAVTTSGGIVLGCVNLSAAAGHTNTGAADVLLWGAQLELSASYATSYLATTSASVTRSTEVADVAITLPALTGLSVANSVTTPPVITNPVMTGTLGDGALGGAAGSTNYFTTQDTGGNLQAVTAGAGLPVSYTGGAMVAGPHRYSVFHTGTTLSDCIDGACGVGAAGAFSNPTYTRFRVGTYSNASQYMDGVTKQVCIDPNPARCR